jgi:hypothetical protein
LTTVNICDIITSSVIIITNDNGGKEDRLAVAGTTAEHRCCACVRAWMYACVRAKYQIAPVPPSVRSASW